jgi:hypothetical protein
VASCWRHLIRRHDDDVKIVRDPEGEFGAGSVLLGRRDVFALTLSLPWSRRATRSSLPCARIAAGNWTTSRDDESRPQSDSWQEEDLIARGGKI